MSRLALFAAVGLCACAPATASLPKAHSSSIAIDHLGARVYVANPDADSISVIDTATRTRVAEVLLGEHHPTVAADGSFTPVIMPRTVALSVDEQTLYVVGERSGRVYAVSVGSWAVKTGPVVGSEPFGVVASPDGAELYVTVSQDDVVARVNAHSLEVEKKVSVAARPWALGFGADDQTLLVTHFIGAQVTTLSLTRFLVSAAWMMPELTGRTDARLAQGVSRGLYDVAVRPGTTETWVAHTLLTTQTAQPQLNFENTAFPALTVFTADGTLTETLTTDAQDVPGIDGAFADVVAVPRALRFSSDGRFAWVLDLSSEDVLVVDATTHAEASLLRPLPGHLQEGLVVAPDGRSAWVHERGTSDVALLSIDEATGALAVEGTVPLLETDPMPAKLRLGQHLFYSANSDEYPIATNHWVSCSTCHLEGRSDAVVWRFAEGPRDTPSNAGGMRHSGFLLRTAVRTTVQDYWATINVEQGGHFTPGDPVTDPLLDALADYVNGGIPLPIPPTTDAAKVALGKRLFERPSVGCLACHPGEWFTDSGQGNPTLDLSGPVVLHDIGDCVTTGFADAAHTDTAGHPRAACQFDTPSLRGVASSAPYLHDGSAATLREVLERTRGTMGDITALSSDELDALVEYMRSL
jgi:YVTN family beta-propeller protein